MPPPSRLSDQLVSTARDRVRRREGQSEGDLRRATSDLYYALFHRICETMADMVDPDPATATSKEAWRRLYRGAEHGQIEQQCRAGEVRSHGLVFQSFAAEFVARKNLREKADYDPLATFDITEVRKALEVVESILDRFDEQPQPARRAFAVYAVLRPLPRG